MSLPGDSVLEQALSMPLSDQDERVFDVVELIEGYLTNPLVSSMGKSNDVRQSRMFKKLRAEALLLLSRMRKIKKAEVNFAFDRNGHCLTSEESEEIGLYITNTTDFIALTKKETAKEDWTLFESYKLTRAEWQEKIRLQRKSLDSFIEQVRLERMMPYPS